MTRVLFILICLQVLPPPRQQAIAATFSIPAKQGPALNQDFADPMILRQPDGSYYAYASGTLTDHPRELVPRKPLWARQKIQFWAPHVVITGSGT